MPILAAIIFIMVVGAVVWGVRVWPWRAVTKRRVLVQTDADIGFEGILYARRGPLLVLHDVTVRSSNSARADGLVVVERDRVLWIQVVN